MRVKFDTELIGDSQNQCAGFCYGLVSPEPLNKDVWGGIIPATEDRSGRGVSLNSGRYEFMVHYHVG
jgi:hypothetical protein